MAVSQPWLGRYADVALISENSAFRILSVIDIADGARRVVVAATERARPDLAHLALTRLHRAHHDPPHPVIPRSLGLDTHEGLAYVVFDFPGRLDLDRLLQIGADAGWRAPYGPSDGFSLTIRDAMFASAERTDPETGRPLCFGTMALGNVLFAVDGSHGLIGFGHNVVVHDEQGRVVVRNRFFQAPEVAVGAPPTRSSDLIGMIEMTRAMMSFVSVHPAIGRVLMGNTLGEDLELIQLVQWFESRVMRGPVWSRPPVDEIIATSNRIRALLGSVPDAPAFKAFVARMLAAERPDLSSQGLMLRVGQGGLWFERPDEPRVDLRRSQIQTRLLWRLVRERLDAPGHALDADALVESLWPGEKMLREAGMNRLYVAINNLRRAGLGDALERVPAGYRIRPDVHVETSDP